MPGKCWKYNNNAQITNNLHFKYFKNQHCFKKVYWSNS